MNVKLIQSNETPESLKEIEGGQTLVVAPTQDTGPNNFRHLCLVLE